MSATRTWDDSPSAPRRAAWRGDLEKAKAGMGIASAPAVLKAWDSLRSAPCADDAPPRRAAGG